MLTDPDGADNILGTDDDNFQLLDGSPAIDAGSNLVLPLDAPDLDGDSDTTERLPWDYNSLPRFIDDPTVPDTGVPDPPIYIDVVDLGAFERSLLVPVVPSMSWFGIVILVLVLSVYMVTRSPR